MLPQGINIFTKCLSCWCHWVSQIIGWERQTVSTGCEGGKWVAAKGGRRQGRPILLVPPSPVKLACHIRDIEKFRWYSILSPSSCQSRSWAKTGSAWKPHWHVGWAFPRFPTQSSFSPGSQWLRLNPGGFDVLLGLWMFLSNWFLKLTPNQLASPFQKFSREATHSDTRWAIPS